MTAQTLPLHTSSTSIIATLSTHSPASSTLWGRDTADVQVLSAVCSRVRLALLLCVEKFTQNVNYFTLLSSPHHTNTSTTGSGLKYCSFRAPSLTVHSFTSHQQLSRETNGHSTKPCTPQDDTHSEVFLKTFGFFCALKDKGCAFSSHADFSGSSDSVLQDNDHVIVESNDESNEPSCRRCRVAKCRGRLVLLYDKYNQPYIKSVICAS